MVRPRWCHARKHLLFSSGRRLVSFNPVDDLFSLSVSTIWASRLSISAQVRSKRIRFSTGKSSLCRSSPTTCSFKKNVTGKSLLQSSAASPQAQMHTVASRAGYGSYTTPSGRTGTFYSPTAAAIAQGNAAAQNDAMFAATIERGQQNMAQLEQAVIKDNTLMPGEWYGGQLHIFAADEPSVGKSKKLHYRNYGRQRAAHD